MLRAALSDGPSTVKELGDLATGFVGTLGLWVDLVRVPPAGTWERRRADRLALAEDWVGPCDATETDGLRHLVRAYLRAFGPASWRDIASWAGITPTVARTVRQRSRTRSRLSRRGRPRAPRSARCAPAGSGHRRPRSASFRTGTPPARPRATDRAPARGPPPQGVPTGTLLGRDVPGRRRRRRAWSLSDGRIVLEPFEDLRAGDRRAVEREREALEAFHA